MAEFDPDALNLSKDDILYAVGKIKARWKKNPKANFVLIHGITIFKFGIMAVPEGQLVAVWRAMLDVMNRTVEQNALCRMRGEYPKARAMIDKAVDDLEDREF